MLKYQVNVNVINIDNFAKSLVITLLLKIIVPAWVIKKALRDFSLYFYTNKNLFVFLFLYLNVLYFEKKGALKMIRLREIKLK